MPKYKVIAEQKMEFSKIKAKDGEDAIEQATFLFDEDFDGDYISLFIWKAINEETGKVEEVAE